MDRYYTERCIIRITHMLRSRKCGLHFMYKGSRVLTYFLSVLPCIINIWLYSYYKVVLLIKCNLISKLWKLKILSVFQWFEKSFRVLRIAVIFFCRFFQTYAAGSCWCRWWRVLLLTVTTGYTTTHASGGESSCMFVATRNHVWTCVEGVQRTGAKSKLLQTYTICLMDCSCRKVTLPNYKVVDRSVKYPHSKITHLKWY